MLTVKIVYGTNQGEKLYAADTVTWAKEQKKLTLEKDNIDTKLILREGDVCFVMNEHGSTVATYANRKPMSIGPEALCQVTARNAGRKG